VVASVVLVGDGVREREPRFPLAALIYTIGRHVRLVGVEFVLHPLILLGRVEDRRGDITSTVDNALVVESAIREQEVDFENLDTSEPRSTASASSSSLRT